ncbi:MAG: hypothetical protein JOY84_15925 [Curvibacter sp.]|nr:hypothetical protein [Curvibacter sp.]
MSDAPACPCGLPDPRHRPLPYAACCGRWIEGESPLAAPTPEALMRSRYTAFVLEKADYLLATWHPSTRPASIEFSPQTRWLGLAIRAARLTDEGRGEVEFVARYREGSGRAERLHERSRFVREADPVLGTARWYYLDGEFPKECA